MPRYGPVWLEIAAEHYAQLPEAVRALVDVRLEQLLENPNQRPVSAHDERTYQWTTGYGDGLGLIVDVVVREPGQSAARNDRIWHIPA
jgi:hypothetical protein